MEGDVAGDLHDVIELRDGRVAAVIGDVAGFGPAAAERADDLQEAFRRAFRHRHDPIEVLAVIDAWVQTRGDELFATLACALVDVGAGVVHVARAGHPPIVVREPAGARFVEGLADPPLGMGGGRRLVSYSLASEATLFLYTDGLVERRGAVLDDNLDVLLGLASALPAGSASAGELARRATEVLGAPADDATVISVRTRSNEHAAPRSPSGGARGRPAGTTGLERPLVRLRAYLDRGDLRSSGTEAVVQELARRLAGTMQVDLEIVDSAGGESDLEADGVLAVPMVLRIAPAPVIRVVGAVRSAEELARALHLPIEGR